MHPAGQSVWVQCSMSVILFFDCLLEGKGRLWESSNITPLSHIIHSARYPKKVTCGGSLLLMLTHCDSSTSL